MIIEIRGTSGSGKSTAMKRVMELIPGTWKPRMAVGRKQPLYYRNGNIIVLGHYNSPCGGCDTIGSAKAVYELITELLPEAGIILCEGLLLSEDVKWSSQLPDLRVIYLNTPLETCLAQIQKRRTDAGNDKPLNPANTTNRVKTIERSREKLAALGCKVCRLSQNQTVKTIVRWCDGV